MKQELTQDSVQRRIDASPEALYDVISDVTRMPELSPEIVACEWLDGATGPAAGVRFRATNHAGRGPNWRNTPVITVADRAREFAFSRSERNAGTIVWSYQFTRDGDGTLVTESYQVIRPVRLMGWFVIGVLYGSKDRKSELRQGMEKTLENLAEVAAGDRRAGTT